MPKTTFRTEARSPISSSTPVELPAGKPVALPAARALEPSFEPGIVGAGVHEARPLGQAFGDLVAVNLTSPIPGVSGVALEFGPLYGRFADELGAPRGPAFTEPNGNLKQDFEKGYLLKSPGGMLYARRSDNTQLLEVRYQPLAPEFSALQRRVATVLGPPQGPRIEEANGNVKQEFVGGYMLQAPDGTLFARRYDNAEVFRVGVFQPHADFTALHQLLGDALGPALGEASFDGSSQRFLLGDIQRNADGSLVARDLSGQEIGRSEAIPPDFRQLYQTYKDALGAPTDKAFIEPNGNLKQVFERGYLLRAPDGRLFARRLDNADLTTQGPGQGQSGFEGSDVFRALLPSVQASVRRALGRHAEQSAEHAVLTRVVMAAGFSALGEADQNRVMNMVGGTNSLSTRVRAQLSYLIAQADFTAATPAAQGERMRAVLTDPSSLPALSGDVAFGDAQRAPYTVGAPVAEDFAFSTGYAACLRYDVTIGGKTVPVRISSGALPAGESMASIEDVAMGLAALPPSSLELVREVNVHAAPNTWDSYWADVYKTPGFRSYMTAGAAGVVDIYPTTYPIPQRAVETSLIHETGHVLSQTVLGSADGTAGWVRWNEAAAADGLSPSRYAQRADDEDFAETLVLYQRFKGTPQEDEFRAMFSARFALIDQILAGTFSAGAAAP